MSHLLTSFRLLEQYYMSTRGICVDLLALLCAALRLCLVLLRYAMFRIQITSVNIMKMNSDIQMLEITDSNSGRST